MDLYIERDQLTWALGRAQAIVERRSTHRILSSVLLEAGPDGLRYTASDSEITLTGLLPANVQQPGALAVEVEHLHRLVRELPTSPLRLRQEGGSLVVEAGASWFKIHVLPAEDYPGLPEFEGRQRLQVAAGDLRWMIERVAFSICQDDNRYGINGGHLEAVEDAEGRAMVRLVGTDGHRLSYAQVPYEGEFGMQPQRLVPRKALRELSALCDRQVADTPVGIAFGESGVLAEVGQDRFFFRLLDGSFPGYRDVLPTSFKRRATVERAPLQSAVKRAGLLANAQTGRVKFDFQPDRVVISTSNVDIGSGQEEVPLELEGEPLEMGFNARYFQDALQHAETDLVRLDLNEALLPVLIREIDNDGNELDRGLFVVMPMRLE